MKTHLGFRDLADLTIGLAIMAEVENREKLLIDGTLLTEGWRAVWSVGAEECFAENVRSFVLSLEMSEERAYKHRLGQGEGFDTDELDIFQEIAKEAGWEVNVRQAIFGPCADKVLEACRDAGVKNAHLIILDKSIGEVGLEAIGEMLARAEDDDRVAIEALDKIRKAFDDWRIDGYGDFEFGGLPDVQDFETLNNLCRFWVPHVNVANYMPKEAAVAEAGAEAPGE